MKFAFFILAIVITANVFVSAQGNDRTDALEQEIRRLDLAAAEAIRKKDFEALDKLCAEDFTTNSPRNVIVKGREALKSLLRSGVVDYASFTREIETVLIHKTTVIVMGRETVVTNETAVQPRQTLERRYTNIWIKRGGRWLLTARHASVIHPD